MNVQYKPERTATARCFSPWVVASWLWSCLFGGGLLLNAPASAAKQLDPVEV